MNPYNKPKNLSKKIPKNCLSKSLFKTFRIFFKKNNDTRNINGIEIMKAIMSVI